MKKFAAFVLVGILAGAAAETLARLLIHKDALVYQDSLDPALGFELRPGAQGMKAGAWVRINADGLRERDIPRAKPSGEFRVVVVGDEPAFGLGLSEEDTFARRLEGLLKPPAGRKLVVVDLSMYHYGLGQEFELLKVKGLRYHPDLIVLEAQLDQPEMPKTRYDWPRLKNFLRGRSMLARWFMERSFWARPAASGSHNPNNGIEEVLAAFRATLESERVPGLIVLFPPENQKGPRELGGEGQAYLRGARKLGLALYDVSRAWGRGSWSQWRIPREGWPSADGERAAAKGMAPAIQSLIRRRPAGRPEA